MVGAYLVLSALACGGAPRGRPAAPDTLAAIERAEHSERNRRYDEARALYAAAVRDAPDARSRAHAGRKFASALIFWGDYAAAEAQLEAVVRAEPGDPAAWHDLGIVRNARGDSRGAERAFLRAIDAAPRDPRPRIALAAVLVNLRRFEDALAQYEQLLALDLPDRVRSAVHRGMALLRRELARPR